MRSGRRWKLAGLASAAVVAMAILPIGTVFGGAGNTSALLSGGTLTLRLDGNGNRFEHSTLGNEPLTVSGCTVTDPAGDTDLANIAAKDSSGRAGNVGILTSGGATVGIGAAPTRGSGASGTSCGQVNPGESLTVSLGTALAGSLVSQADLDIDGKYGVTVVATLFRAGTQVGQVTQDSPPSADSGADSGANDNFRFNVSGVYFDTVVLTGRQGPSGNTNYSFSLAGGGQTRQPSTFELVRADGALSCGDTASDGYTTLQRGQNVDSVPCKDVVYDLETSTTSDGKNLVVFRYDIGDQTGASYRATIKWPAETITGLPTRVTTIDGAPAQWCDGTAKSPTLPGSATIGWCRTNQAIDLYGTGLAQVTEQFYGIGDPGFGR